MQRRASNLCDVMLVDRHEACFGGETFRRLNCGDVRINQYRFDALLFQRF
uniref:Uncharacterized protein n=1 Tax=Parascaris equorum TaxID=6256 RepID=A0A914RFN7_PAREQ